MFVQVLQDPEGLPTGGAAVWLLARMEPQVCFQVVSEAETFAALRAAVRPLPCVEPQVTAEAFPQCERLGAGWTRVWFFSGVEALVTPEDLSALKCLLANAAGVAVTSVVDHLLELPNAVLARSEAAEAAARVDPLVVAQVFGQRPTHAAVGVMLFTGDLQHPITLGQCEQVHQLHRAWAQQLLVQRRQFQFHLEVVLGILLGLDPFPDPYPCGRHSAVGWGWAVRHAPCCADDGLLRLSLAWLLGTIQTRGRRLRFEDQRANKLDLLWRSNGTQVMEDH